MAKYDSRRYGEASREKADTQSLRDAWATADRMNAELPEGTEWHWVPKTTVFIDEDILPRDGGMDRNLVLDYAAIWHDLPPITVQQASYRLIDGVHRLNAAFETDAATDHVKIIERDVSDEKLAEEAYRANVRHGRPLTLKERTRFAKLLVTNYPNWPISEIAREAGVDRGTVNKLREGTETETVTYTRQRDGEEQTVTRKARSKPAAKEPVTRSPVRSDPAPEPAWESAEPAALTGMRSIASIRDAARWLEANAQFADEVRDYLQPARKILAELADALEGVAV